MLLFKCLSVCVIDRPIDWFYLQVISDDYLVFSIPPITK